MESGFKNLKEKYRELAAAGVKGADADAVIFQKCDDAGVWSLLAPDSANTVFIYPWRSYMEVLELGAAGGRWCHVASHVKSLDIFEEDADERELVNLRFPDAGIRFKDATGLKSEARRYDAVLIPLAGEKAPSGLGGNIRELLDVATHCLKENGVCVIAAENAGALRFTAGDKKEDGAIYADGSTLDKLRREYAAFASVKEYYPLPGAGEAINIYSDGYMPGKGAFRGIAAAAPGKRSIVYNDDAMYANLLGSVDFREIAPAYVFVLSGYNSKGQNAAAAAALPDYVRFNLHRDDRYRVKTEIFKGSRVVRKSAVTAAANAHIDSFREKYERLCTEFNGRLGVLEPQIGVSPAGLKYADFDLLNGADLGKELSESITDGKAPVDKINEALKLIMGDDDEETICLDALFENVIRDGSNYRLIDYEWVSEEPLNRAYVRWRILSYWYASCREALYAYTGEQEFLGEFGIGEDEAAVFAGMEEKFQAEVRGSRKDPERPSGNAPSPKAFEEQELRLRELKDWNLRLLDEIEEHKSDLSKERETRHLSQNHIRNIEAINAARQADIDRLNAEINYLSRHQSIASRIYRRLTGFVDAWAPAGSKRRRVLKLIKTGLRHPARQLSLCMSADGRRLLDGSLNIGGEFSEGGALLLPEAAKPLVSIVIPAYNQVAYTYACIRSIIANTDFEKTPYEVILADDVSTDATAHIDKYIGNLVISRNSVNTGFLKNCNNAAQKARGRYVLFLNNDTKVHPDWLGALVRLIESDESIGMVGSKLIYPDGRLQEAGGIIWADASGWNYGRLDDPDKPEYNYIKDVDYISGAAIMLSKALWDEIGGFDERYAPAYCEDSDLAFEVRRHGKRVVYQPKSVVTHFEGVSNGTDVNGSGLKHYQIANQEKFKEKWADELKNQSPRPENPDPFKARDRSQSRPCVVVIDHYVPTWDKDAGSKTTYQYIRMFVKKGFNVKFIGDNFGCEEPYTGGLEQLGVEVLYGEWYRDTIYEYFKKNKKNIDFCYINRPHIAIKYIDFLKNNTDIRCIFYGHDLHFLRLEREYELTGVIRKKRDADYWRELEFEVMSKTDMNYYPSDVEISAIHKVHPEIPAKAITAYVWDEFLPVPDAAAKRDGLLFVGGFKHPPNADGVKWFAEKIWPRVRKALPECVFYVAGSGADEDITSLDSEADGIRVLGFVSDERLSELYRTTRMTVVPLRYGAGVKGKVVEAIYNHSAVITTSVGAEGIPDAESVMIVTDNDADSLIGNSEAVEDAFAEAIVNNYNDIDRLGAMREATAGYITEHYSIDAAWAGIAGDFIK